MYIRIEIQSLEELIGFFALVRGDDPADVVQHLLKDAASIKQASDAVGDAAVKLGTLAPETPAAKG